MVNVQTVPRPNHIVLIVCHLRRAAAPSPALAPVIDASAPRSNVSPVVPLSPPVINLQPIPSSLSNLPPCASSTTSAMGYPINAPRDLHYPLYCLQLRWLTRPLSGGHLTLKASYSLFPAHSLKLCIGGRTPSPSLMAMWGRSSCMYELRTLYRV